MKKVLIALIALVVIVGVAYAYNKQKTNHTAITNSSNQTNNVRSLNPDPATLGWQTFSDSQNKYTIKYPNDWSYSVSQDHTSTCFTQKGIKYDFEGSRSQCAIRIYIDNSNMNLEDRVKTRIQNNPDYTTTYFTVDNTRGVTIHPVEETYILFENKTYTLDTLGYAQGSGVPELGSIISKMVSTLKFN